MIQRKTIKYRNGLMERSWKDLKVRNGASEKI